MNTKLTWKVAAAPTGRFRAFEKRGWPSASLNGAPMICISCDDCYTPAAAKSGNHAELKVMIAQWFERDGQSHTFKWRTMSKRFATLEEAKKESIAWVMSHQDFWPPALRTKNT